MRLYRDIDALPYLLRLLKFLLSRLEQTHLNLNEQIKTTGTAEHPIWPDLPGDSFPLRLPEFLIAGLGHWGSTPFLGTNRNQESFGIEWRTIPAGHESRTSI